MTRQTLKQLKQNQYAHYFYSVEEFFMYKDVLYYCVCKLFIVFYTVNMYVLCPYGSVHIPLSVWHAYGSMECMYVCMYVCVYVCTYVCMYVCTYVCVCIYIYIYTYVRFFFVGMYLCMYVYVCMYECMYVCRNTIINYRVT
jgi:hypothetical protein